MYGAEEPAGQDRRPAQRGWASFLSEAVAPLRPERRLLGRATRLPATPIRTWQIWNEPNFKYFVARPNPAEYGKLVKLSYAAIKGVDPGAKMILGGLFADPEEATVQSKPPQAYFATDFLDQLYKTTPGIKSQVRRGRPAPVHRSSYQELTPDIEELRDVLKANHDAGKGLWITELGWSSQPRARGSNSFAKAPAARRTSSKAPSPAQGEAGEMAAEAGLLVLGRRPCPAPATSATAPASSARLHAEAVLEGLRQVRRRQPG